MKKKLSFILTPFLFLFAGFIFSGFISLPEYGTQKYEYFIYLKGINTREDVISLQSKIQKKDGVVFFMAERYPVRCFVLRSTRFISELEFASWIDKKFEILSFGEGDKAREAAYSIYSKTNKP